MKVVIRTHNFFIKEVEFLAPIFREKPPIVLSQEAAKKKAALGRDIEEAVTREKSTAAAAVEPWRAERERMQQDVAAAKVAAAAAEAEQVKELRELAQSHMTAMAELRAESERRLADAARQHEMAVSILREKALERSEEAERAGEKLISNLRSILILCTQTFHDFF